MSGPRGRRDHDGGSVSAELALVTPLLLLLLVFVVMLGRLAEARLQVDDAAAQAARAATSAGDAGSASVVARQSATAGLASDGVTCSALSVTTDTSDFVPGGVVRVAVTCQCLDGRPLAAASAGVRDATRQRREPGRSVPQRRLMTTLTIEHGVGTATGTAAGRHDERGQVTAFVVVMVGALMLVAGLVIDGGLALAARGPCHRRGPVGGAVPGPRPSTSPPIAKAGPSPRPDGGHRRPPSSYLATTGDSGQVAVTGDLITVTVQVIQPTQILGIVGLHSLTVSGTASATAVRGITAAGQ